MGKTRILCIFTTLLGNKATTQRIINALNRMETLDPTYVLIGPEDYTRYPAPRITRSVDAWHGRYVARQKAAPVLNQKFDALFVNSWEFVTEFADVAGSIPGAALMDAVPHTVNLQLRRRGQGGWRRWVSHGLQNGPFRNAARQFKAFLPMGSDGADALVQEYGIDRDRCYITLAPQDLDLWKPGPRNHTPPPLRLLFVANDFERKGGLFLLRLFEQHLAGFCTLTIASNDPALEKQALPKGVKCLRGRTKEQLLDVYRSNDVFVFPTQQDYMPQVLCEALATGLPCIANDIGGIRDLVRDGETGYLMSHKDPPEKWAEKLRFLGENLHELIYLSDAARSFAVRFLDQRRFGAALEEVIGHLISAPDSGNPAPSARG